MFINSSCNYLHINLIVDQHSLPTSLMLKFFTSALCSARDITYPWRAKLDILHLVHGEAYISERRTITFHMGSHSGFIHNSWNSQNCPPAALNIYQCRMGRQESDSGFKLNWRIKICKFLYTLTTLAPTRIYCRDCFVWLSKILNTYINQATRS